MVSIISLETVSLGVLKRVSQVIVFSAVFLFLVLLVFLSCGQARGLASQEVLSLKPSLYKHQITC